MPFMTFFIFYDTYYCNLRHSNKYETFLDFIPRKEYNRKMTVR